MNVELQSLKTFIIQNSTFGVQYSNKT